MAVTYSPYDPRQIQINILEEEKRRRAEQAQKELSATQLENGPALRNQAQGYLAGVDQRPRIQATEDPMFRNAQAGLLGQLQGVASGQQQGAGELAAQRAINRALASQRSMVASQRGANGALAAIEGARQSAYLGVQGAGQRQLAAMQDQGQAQQLLGQVSSQGRAADQNLSLANMNAALQARGMDDAQRMALLGQLFGMDQAEMQARLQMEVSKMNRPKSSLMGDLLQMGGTLGAAYLTGGTSLAAQGATGTLPGQNGTGLTSTQYSNLQDPNAFRL